MLCKNNERWIHEDNVHILKNILVRNLIRLINYVLSRERYIFFCAQNSEDQDFENYDIRNDSRSDGN